MTQMNESGLEKVLKEVANALGLQLQVESMPAGHSHTFSLRVTGLPKPGGFELRVRQSLLSWTIDLYLDSFSGDLLRIMNQAYVESHKEVSAILGSAKLFNLDTQLNLNELPIEESMLGMNVVELELRVRARFDIDDNEYSRFQDALTFSLCLLLPLFTIEAEDLDEVWEQEPQEEGVLSRVEVNKYERSRVNRALCLRHHGFECANCKLRMEHIYGPLGAKVIHVHHIQPVSLMDAPRVLDPILDLVPLCPNCHTMIHKRNPPLSLTELSEITRNS